MADKVKQKDEQNDVKEMSQDQLTARLAEAREERANLRFRGATEAIDNPIRLRTLRRSIARMETELRARRANGQ